MKKQHLTLGLIGNPNCGKTTLFNALTGSQQRVGNWPGVTVDRKSGFFTAKKNKVEVVDLPGIYSLTVTSKEGAIDERIATEYMLSDQADLIINVVDASNLERNLYLTTQLLELELPVVVAVNMIDLAKKRGLTIDFAKLSDALKCPVIPINAHRNEGVEQLKQIALDIQGREGAKHYSPVQYPKKINDAVQKLIKSIKEPHQYFRAIRKLETTDLIVTDADLIIADARYTMIHDLVKKSIIEDVHVKPSITAAIDKIVLNRILGIPIFLGVMYLMFFFAINIGGYFQNFFQIGSDAVFVTGLGHLLTAWHIPNWLFIILTAGLGKGINTTLTFIPVLTMMFIFLAILEGSGYMVRAGFVIDRVMTAIGLPGKSFVPLLVGFGCNVPAIMAARTLENKRDRILTVLMTPFMSCGARFAIYAVFTAAFFPKGGQNIVFALYIIGILVAIFTGLILRKTLLSGEQSSLIMEMPPYHLPTLRNTTLQTWCRLKSFIIKASHIIIPVCILLSILNNVYIGKQSTLAIVGRGITPIMKPIGIKSNNWPATVGLITGVVAKEVVVGTLNTLYAQDNVKQSSHHGIYGQMYKQFAGPIGAFAYLLFVLLYFPCVPAIATMFRELGWRWTTFSMLWNTGMAYGVATLFYQTATFAENPVFATISIVSVVVAFLITMGVMRKFRGNPPVADGNHSL
jgi:ferrous iron transport protein B